MKKRIQTFMFFTFMLWSAAIILWLLMAREEYPNAHIMMYFPLLIFGVSPAVAGFLTEKISPDFPGIRMWFARNFCLKEPPLYYALVLILSILYFTPKLLIGEYKSVFPAYYFIIAIPLGVLIGGLEEIGWRNILQKNLERRMNLIPATIITAFAWWCWHLPLIYLPDAPFAGMNPLLHGIRILAPAFALSILRRGTGSIWLCILFHALINAMHFMYRVKETWWTVGVSGAVLLLGSFLLMFIDYKAKRFMRED